MFSAATKTEPLFHDKREGGDVFAATLKVERHIRSSALRGLRADVIGIPPHKRLVLCPNSSDNGGLVQQYILEGRCIGRPIKEALSVIVTRLREHHHGVLLSLDET